MVELPLARLDQERPRPPPRSYVGVARSRGAHQGARSAGAVPQLGAPVRPCAADLRDRGVTTAAAVRSAIAALRGGRPIRITGSEPAIAVAAVETVGQGLLDLLDPA